MPWAKNKEAFLIPDNVAKLGKTVISTSDAVYSTPKATFNRQMETFERIPELRESIIHTAMEVLGDGYFTTINDSYTVKLPHGNEKQWTAKEALDFFNTENNVDERLLTVAIELIAFGNSILQITPLGLRSVNIRDVIGAEAAEKGISKVEKYNILLSQTCTPSKLKWGEFLHFRSIVTSSSEPFGTGVIVGLIAAWKEGYKSVMDSVQEMRQAMLGGFEQFSQPTQFIRFPNVPDSGIQAKADEVKKLPIYGGRFTTNEEVEIISPSLSSERQYELFVDTMFDLYIMSMGDPSLKASVESGFTEASIKGSIELYRKKVQVIRRTVKRLVEKLFIRVLTEFGFDAVAAQPKLNFGAEEISWTVKELTDLVINQIISKEEARTMLTKKAKIELEPRAA